MKPAPHLNEQQKAAVEHREGPLLILAGAGSGKTGVIVHRIAELVREGVAPERILAVTFTNKAANEMKERVAAIVQNDLSLSPHDVPRTEPFIGTFHALSLHMIRAFHRDLGLPKRFTIYDRQDSLRAAREAIRAAGFDPKELAPARVIAVMSRHKGETLSVDEFRDTRARSYADEAIAEVWEQYDAALRKESALDFDDILVTAHDLLTKHADARRLFENAWDYLHIDEYQDVNLIQYEIMRMLAEKRRNIAVVGDHDQSIYSWRGASIKHIMNFESDFPRATVILLTENYRSTKTIVRAANDAIAKNTMRKEKELFTNNTDGERVTIGGFGDESEEAAFVARESARLIRRGTPAEEVSVLYRANFQSRALEEAFLAEGVPYQVLGTRFFERAEIKDALSYLRLAENPDSTSDLARIINMPSRGVGPATLAKIVAKQEETLTDITRGKLANFWNLVERIRNKISSAPASKTVSYVLAESGLRALYEKGKGEDEEKLENLKELVSVATRYDTLPPPEGIERLIEEAALRSDQDELPARREDRSGVKLMTVHASKGLEFDTVFVTGLEQGLFPYDRVDTERVDEEEERRLFYVALTRAKRKAYLTCAFARRIFGTRVANEPSEFLTELDPALVEFTNGTNWHEKQKADITQ